MPADAPPEDRSACSPCRGTGKVVSNLGGESHEVTCPWCGGSGAFQPGHDALAAAREAAGRSAGSQPAAS